MTTFGTALRQSCALESLAKSSPYSLTDGGALLSADGCLALAKSSADEVAIANVAFRHGVKRAIELFKNPPLAKELVQ